MSETYPKFEYQKDKLVDKLQLNLAATLDISDANELFEVLKGRMVFLDVKRDGVRIYLRMVGDYPVPYTSSGWPVPSLWVQHFFYQWWIKCLLKLDKAKTEDEKIIFSVRKKALGLLVDGLEFEAFAPTSKDSKKTLEGKLLDDFSEAVKLVNTYQIEDSARYDRLRFVPIDNGIFRDKVRDGEPSYFNFLASLKDLEEYFLDKSFNLVKISPVYDLVYIDDLEDVKESIIFRFNQVIEQGCEGIIIRDIKAKYKHGRSTLTDLALAKVVPLNRVEVLVEGYTPLLVSDTNGLEFDESRIGSLSVVIPETKVRFNVGTGLNDEDRRDLDVVGRYAVIEYKRGNSSIPRQPVFIGWRHPKDMDSE